VKDYVDAVRYGNGIEVIRHTMASMLGGARPSRRRAISELAS
jgi:hypothetical protein